MVEFCCTTRVFDANDVARAQANLQSAAPEIDRTPPATDFFEAAKRETVLAD
jgi:hypothetical protein